eukprot:CAMPEP_0172522644 /NCGR_PEP_ID=MMETSP1066-20121228/293239_1 /TAXON_ID=671091 /ORGANISM="Coscinodiscus wailesii, Strain CCMP2513" /LENGTH=56 /DNA_ID=CAMNT_0013305669 /DNA_START=98 /DNA_END=268 /DNA_ORIENTATION=-
MSQLFQIESIPYLDKRFKYAIEAAPPGEKPYPTLTVYLEPDTYAKHIMKRVEQHEN